MTGRRIVRLLALAGVLSLVGCRAWCERYNPPPSYAPNCGCYQPQQPCCAPASNYVQPQPCAPTTQPWSSPGVHP